MVKVVIVGPNYHDDDDDDDKDVKVEKKRHSVSSPNSMLYSSHQDSPEVNCGHTGTFSVCHTSLLTHKSMACKLLRLDNRFLFFE
ncbi:hypothetical protein ElyMa_003511200 [Elysia marginata]|uniref:Uncharacterized protein n=1 Tax=Elysia marginata TaxID=1093978 RepID=A0AAV4EFW7_9GAST|nr:hypothetical protein ElyMa_003511200 [Elysia marginata]